ncbi:hypothetical protein [Macrococcus brunensis]|uniref:hypothetical protein n=1 Tax=Macrococcus brunensis TaxID=198483 RepID=UPI001EF053EA|nr:hypothetical protein [Macrococcus brunensis]ULG72238.1 hypothetical protein MGG12_01550 [Macrococcus brunensis]ULG74497.1 hypothetical protein MGG13_01615 [Macrococcus brunensis]
MSNNNWPPKHHGEHNPEGRTGNQNLDTPGLKGREDDTYAKNVAGANLSGAGILDKIASIFIHRDTGRK